MNNQDFKKGAFEEGFTGILKGVTEETFKPSKQDTIKKEAFDIINEHFEALSGDSDEDYREKAKRTAIISVNKLINITGAKKWYEIKREIERS